ncbi:kinase-like domain-containing protein [Mycena floridula]|nr:kinase-like domain-containing protein [Mycena floridula]
MPMSSVLSGPELVAKVDDFLQDVSCEVDAASETVDAVRTVAEACFFQRSISIHEFVRRATGSLENYPNLARKLTVFLHASGERLEVIVNDVPTVELIVIHGPVGGQIYALSDAIQAPPIPNTAALRAFIQMDTFEHDFTNATSSSSWAQAIAELLQQQLIYSSFDFNYSMMCLRYLRRLARQKGILPPSFFLHDVVRDGFHPVFGGGFADVFKGRLNGEVVCLKALRFFIERPEMAQKLLNDCCREALVWKQLDHPNVLPFLGVNVDLFAPSFCLVSPWMSNGNLIQFLHQHPDFDRRNAIIDIASAMQYLHENLPPIVHADIRGVGCSFCSMLLLVRDDLRCCLADFGLCSIAASFSVTSSSSGNGKGAIRWMAPELFVTSGDGNQLKSPSRDIYAFACTILEVYTGQPPFVQHKHDPAVIHEVSSGRRAARPVNIPDDLWALIEACWQQDSTSRPAARTVVQTLRAGSLPVHDPASSRIPARPQLAKSTSEPISTNQNSMVDDHISSSPVKLTPLRRDFGEDPGPAVEEKPKRAFWSFGRKEKQKASPQRRPF